MSEHKICSCCKIEKPTSDFSWRNKAKGWLRSACKTCECKRTMDYAKKHPEKVKENITKWRLQNPEKMSQQNKKWMLENRERREIWRQNHYKKTAKKQIELAKKWAKENYLRSREICSARRKITKNQVPWYDAKKVSDFYKEAKRLTEITGIPHEVDHIVPLRGKTVSGLHVQNNLQILTRSENIKKGNRQWPDMP